MTARAKAADDDLEIAKSRVVTLQTTARGGAPSKNLAQRYLPADDHKKLKGCSLCVHCLPSLRHLVSSCLHWILQHGMQRPMAISTCLITNKLACVCRWLKLVDAAQNGTVQQTEDAYQKFLLTLADMELLVSPGTVHRVTT